MALPVTRYSPLTGADSDAMASLTWEWICWLKSWRSLYENGNLELNASVADQVKNYFAAFRDDRGFTCVGDDMTMPSDARVDFIYIPSITSVSIQHLVQVALGNQRFHRDMRRALTAAAGRRFQGHGYDAERYMVYALELLAYGKLIPVQSRILSSNMSFYRAITECYSKLSSQLVDAPEEMSWGGISDEWARYGLRLLNHRDNWELLTASPAISEFERELKPSPNDQKQSEINFNE